MELNFNSVETIPVLNASAAFKTDRGKVFKEDIDIVPTIIDKSLSYCHPLRGWAVADSSLRRRKHSHYRCFCYPVLAITRF